jgi:HrpA-like RNA helicase
MNLLRKIGACELNEPKLTPLGQHLAALPVNVKIGKMLIFGAIFGCLDPVVSEMVLLALHFKYHLARKLLHLEIILTFNFFN